MATHDTLTTLAEALIESDTVGVFDDSNAGQAAARAAADLLLGWQTYGPEYQQAQAAIYQPADVTEVIRQLRAWLAKGCPTAEGGSHAAD